MNDAEFSQLPANDLIHIIGHRCGVSFKEQLILAQVQFATTEQELESPRQAILALCSEEAEKLILSLQLALDRLRQSN